MADAPAGFHEAGAPWIERWCEDHPGDVAAPGCMSCLGESHDAWMHRARAAEADAYEAEQRAKRFEVALRRIEKTTRSSSGGWLATFMGVRLNDANRTAQDALKAEQNRPNPMPSEPPPGFAVPEKGTTAEVVHWFGCSAQTPCPACIEMKGDEAK